MVLGALLLMTLQEKGLFSSAKTLENTQMLSEKVISEKIIPSTVVVLSGIGKT